MEASTKEFKLTLESTPESITKVESFIDQIKEEVGFSDDIYGNMLIGLTEAVNNAIFHGNKKDPEKKVYIAAEYLDNMLIFFIKDEGPGFDYNNLPDPTSKENLEKPSGRGIFLMKQLSDLVIFSENGSRLEVQYRL